MSDNDIVIVSAYRTPIGSFNGSLSTLKAHELGATVLKHILSETKAQPDELILGQALQAGAGQNPARQTALAGGCDNAVTATTINMLCGSGLKACVLGYLSVKDDNERVVVCGGQESMSQAPHCINIRSGHRMGDAAMTDTMIKDGLTDAFHNVLMGVTAEKVAQKYQISREDQDKFAVGSQQKYKAAHQRGDFKDEIVPVKIVIRKDEKVLNEDEFPKPDTNLDSLKRLRPSFASADEGGSVTAGNASGINDGAALVMMTSFQQAKKRGLTPLVKIVSWAEHGGEPLYMGVAPIEAIKKAVQKAKWTLNDVEVFELNEAFSSQSVAILRELNLDESKVNVNGGSIAIGHPIGCSGARVLVTLIHILKRTGKKRGLAALCIGGGLSVAMCVEAY